MSLVDDLRSASLTGELSEEQLADFAAIGEVREFAPGDELFHEGRPADELWMLLDGVVELVQHVGQEVSTFVHMTEPGQWAGGHAAWAGGDDHAVFLVTGRAGSVGRCFVVPADELGAFVRRWLPLGKHLLDAVYQTVRRVDATARQRESIVALGTLAAGLAHEINNPASASLRAVESLRSTTSYVLQSLVGLAQEGVGAGEFLELDRMRVELQRRPHVDGDALEVADREEAIGGWLEGRGVEFAWQMAPILAGRGADEQWFSELESITGADGLGPAVRWVTSTLGVEGLLSELTDATDRISHLVQDVKTYSQLDRAALQRTDLTAGIESTLTMLAPKLEGIDVVRDYGDDVTEVDVYAAELNQVWTNLIDNALDAMAGEGTLRLAVALDGPDVVVQVGDTGTGIDPGILHRVFEPFFTTKDVGSGTGLGLDISRRIVVDRHGGSIEFESAPGSTTATVRIPRER